MNTEINAIENANTVLRFLGTDDDIYIEQNPPDETFCISVVAPILTALGWNPEMRRTKAGTWIIIYTFMVPFDSSVQDQILTFKQFTANDRDFTLAFLATAAAAIDHTTGKA